MNTEQETAVKNFADQLKGESVDRLMSMYRKLQVKTKDAKNQIDYLKALSDVVETRLNDYLLDTNQEGAITQYGAVKRVLKQTYYVEDKPAFRDWAIQNGQDALLSISVTQKAMNQFIEDQHTNFLREQASGAVSTATFTPQLPAGINIKQEFSLSITRK